LANADDVKVLIGNDSPQVKDRKFLELRGKGDFYHNMAVLKTGGELVLWRRPNADDVVTVEDYIPCKFCLSFIMRHDMWKHVKTCPLKTQEAPEQDLIAQANLILYSNKYCTGATRELKELILSGMLKDQVTEVVIKDQLICTYGSFLLQSSGIKRSNEISQRMRILARLVLRLRAELAEKSNSFLIDFIDVAYFDKFVTCTQDLGGFSLENNEGETLSSFKTPSLPLKIGYSLQKCLTLLKGLAIKQKDLQLKTKAYDFSEVFDIEWKARIATVCHRTLDDNKFNKVVLLPITEDLLKVRSFLKEEIPIITNRLRVTKKTEDWRYLAELVGTRLTIFNRRRGNEVYQLLITKFSDRKKKKNAEIDEIKNSLTPLEKRLANR